ncbi:4452_t:CDS:2 [Paraglomus occultum]|uniref:4452_t:CDS:1 n=1 Tax=Paraglomus occultum TaxID=144539 RepID=A0A9N9B960_9GLOM|nr:4452_t:CDS:2 [Paraglomus occultum]
MKPITYSLAFLAVTALSAFSVNAGILPTHPDGATIVHPGDETYIESYMKHLPSHNSPKRHDNQLTNSCLLFYPKKLTILWKENGEAPPLENLGNVAVKFMTGGDLNQIELKVIDTVDAKVGQLKYVIPVVAPAGKIYFIRFDAGQNQYYTTRFIVTDVNGQYPPPPNPPPPVGQNQGGNGTIVSDAPGAGGANNTNTTSPNPTPTNPNSDTNKPTNSNSTDSSNTPSTNKPSMSTRTLVSKGLSFGAVVGGMAYHLFGIKMRGRKKVRQKQRSIIGTCSTRVRVTTHARFNLGTCAKREISRDIEQTIKKMRASSLKKELA